MFISPHTWSVNWETQTAAITTPARGFEGHLHLRSHWVTAHFPSGQSFHRPVSTHVRVRPMGWNGAKLPGQTRTKGGETLREFWSNTRQTTGSLTALVFRPRPIYMHFSCIFFFIILSMPLYFLFLRISCGCACLPWSWAYTQASHPHLCHQVNPERVEMHVAGDHPVVPRGLYQPASADRVHPFTGLCRGSSLWGPETSSDGSIYTKECLDTYMYIHIHMCVYIYMGWR